MQNSCCFELIVNFMPDCTSTFELFLEEQQTCFSILDVSLIRDKAMSVRHFKNPPLSVNIKAGGFFQPIESPSLRKTPLTRTPDLIATAS
jgi:hypothetical protein